MWASTRRLKSGRAAAALVACVVAAGAVWYAVAPRPIVAPQPVAGGGAATTVTQQTVLVFVSGAVAHPGLYRLSSGARVADALAAAGGVTAAADPGRLPNLSALVRDGHQVNVPLAKGTATVPKLDINTATADELASLPGMPAGLPDEIVQFRSRWGPFITMTQLHDDLGVDTATVAGLRPYLRIDPTLSP